MNYTEAMKVWNKFLTDDMDYVKKNLAYIDKQLSSINDENKELIDKEWIDMLQSSFVALTNHYPSFTLASEKEYNRMLRDIRKEREYTDYVKIDIPRIEKDNTYIELVKFLELCAKMYIKGSKNICCDCHDK